MSIGFIFFFLDEEEKRLTKEEEKQVMIEKAINLRLMCDYVVSCSYGDIVLLICMLHDYIKMMDKIKGEDDIKWKVYYRQKFQNMADRLAEQIEYDYEAAVEKCRKKWEKQEKNSDVGEDALVLALKRGAGKKPEKTEEGKNDGRNHVSEIISGV